MTNSVYTIVQTDRGGGRVYDVLADFEAESYEEAIDRISDEGESIDLVESWGSDAASRPIFKGKFVNIPPIPLTRDGRRDVESWVTEDGGRIISRLEEDIESVFVYTDNPIDIEDGVIIRQGVLLFKSTNNTTKLFRMKIRDNYRELSGKRYQQRGCYVLPLNVCDTSYFDSGNRNKFEGMGQLGSIEETLEILLEMSCVFVSFYLYFGTGRLVKRIQELMGMDTNKTLLSHEVCRNISVPMKIKNVVDVYKGDVRHYNTLIAAMEYCLRGEGVTYKDPLSERHIAMLALFFGIDICIILEGQYKRYRTAVHDLTKETTFKVRGGVDLIRDVYKDVFGSSANTIYCMMKGFTGKRSDHSSSTVSLVLLASDISAEYGHIDPEMDVKQGTNFCNFMGHALIGQALKTYVPNGAIMEVQHDESGKREEIGVFENDRMRTDAYYTAGNLKIQAKKDPDPPPGLCLSITTGNELMQLTTDIIGAIRKDETHDHLVNHTHVYISPTAWDMEGLGYNDCDVLCVRFLNLLQVADVFMKTVQDYEKEHEKECSISVCGARIATREYLIRKTKVAATNYTNRVEQILQWEENGYASKKDAEMYIDNQLREENELQTHNINSAGNISEFTVQHNGGITTFFNKEMQSTVVLDTMFEANERLKFGIFKADGDYNDIMKEEYTIRVNRLESLCKNARTIEESEKWRKMLKVYQEKKGNKWDESGRDLTRHSTFMDIVYAEGKVNYIKRQQLIPPHVLCTNKKMDRILTNSSPHVDMIRNVNQAHVEIQLPPYGYDGRGIVKGVSLTEIDVNSQYLLAATGMFNRVFLLDKNGMYPAMMMDDSPSCQMITNPLLSYYADAGTINIDPSIIDMERLEELEPRHGKLGSCLHKIVTQRDGSKVMSSLYLISTTMQLWKDHGGDMSIEAFAEMFQFGILKIKTGRFLFDKDIRGCLTHVLKGNQKWKLYGSELFEHLEELKGCISQSLDHLLIIPNDFDLTIGDTYDTVKVNPKLKQKLQLRRRGGYIKTWLYEVALSSVEVFVEIRKIYMKIKESAGNEMSDEFKRELKKMFNCCVGSMKNFKSSGMMMKRESFKVHLTNTGVPYVYKDINEYNPVNFGVVVEFPKSGTVLCDTYSVKFRTVMRSQSSFRDYIMMASAVQMEHMMFELPTQIQVGAPLFGTEDAPINIPVRRLCTDSIAVEEEYAHYIIKGFKKTIGVRMVDGVEVNPLEGFGIGEGYKTKVLSWEDMKQSLNRFGRMMEGKSSSCTLGCDTCPASVRYPPTPMKQRLDTSFRTIVTQLELLSKWYGESMHDIDHLMNTPADLVELLYREQPLLSEEDKEKVKTCRVEFEKYQIQFIMKFKRIYISGPPGVGKTYLAKQVACYMANEKEPTYDDMGNRRLMPVKCLLPLHSLKSGYKNDEDTIQKGVKYICNTNHAEAGCGITTSSLARNPSDVYYKKGSFKEKVVLYASLGIADEIEAVSRDFEHVLPIIAKSVGRMIYMGDKFQSTPPVGAGVRVEGSVMDELIDVEYQMSIQMRKIDPNYIRLLNKSRSGDSSVYLPHNDTNDGTTSLSVYHSGKVAEDKLCDIIEEIGIEHASGVPVQWTMVVQDHNQEATMIHRIARCMVVEKEPDFALTYVGPRKTILRIGADDVPENDLKEKYELGKTMHRHGQKKTGAPLLFYKGAMYIVRKSFSTHAHYKNGTEEENALKNNIYMSQDKRLKYMGHRLVMCKLVPVKEKKRKIGDPIVVPGHKKLEVELLDFEDEEGVPCVLTEFEAASYLLYPFIAQKSNLIGLTFKKVVDVQVSVLDSLSREYSDAYLKREMESGLDRRYVRTYVPSKIKAAKNINQYGPYSFLCKSFRQDQVTITRVTEGSVLRLDIQPDIDYDGPGRHCYINYNCLTGATLGGFCARWTIEDQNNNTIKDFNKRLTNIYNMRSQYVIVDGNPGVSIPMKPRDNVLEFPKERLSAQGITMGMLRDTVYMYPIDKTIRIEDLKRKREEYEEQYEADILNDIELELEQGSENEDEYQMRIVRETELE